MNKKSQLYKLNQDFLKSISLYRFWLFLSYDDIQRQYRRTFLGPFWISLTTAIFIVFFSLIGSQIFNIDLNSYLPYFCCGHLLYLYIQQTIGDSCHTFITAAPYLKESNYPKFVFILRLFSKNIFLLLHNLPILAIVLFIYSKNLNTNISLFFLNFLIVNFFIFWLCSILALAAARYRDLPMITVNILQILVFFTPIMWQPSQISTKYHFIIDFNPMAWLLILIRSPLLGQSIDYTLYLRIIVMSLILMLLTVYLYTKNRKNILYWI
jgi:lipopolysaccharide transport system permease protein